MDHGRVYMDHGSVYVDHGRVYMDHGRGVHGPWERVHGPWDSVHEGVHGPWEDYRTCTCTMYMCYTEIMEGVFCVGILYAWIMDSMFSLTLPTALCQKGTPWSPLGPIHLTSPLMKIR